MSYIINIRFWLAERLIGRHSAMINCRHGVPEGHMAWSANGRSSFCTEGDPR